ncbi:putative vacuolar (H+)-ATPase G subunit [Rosa chinensis]|uniref:Putative vacuolar (H+)-ATPase G subunit n=2 Tax=Rosa chinensis TaxID=74649 RepID=A0A2P6SJG8_ROSCH|nr:V-type proton ATPase subunit G isoform X2 [Rosa chinensis]PRQ58820.1 putative vacuolar (H+)-ATPase G subunit [Rosa chinensis]
MEVINKHNTVQQLLTVEQEVQQILNASRNAKTAKLKQAKEEAEKENADFHAQMEVDFQRKHAEGGGHSGPLKRIEQETEAFHHLKIDAARISNDIVRMLLEYTTVTN